jgi:hypothetical protein
LLASSSLYASCEQSSDHAGMRACLEKEETALFKKIRAEQKIILDRITAWDEEQPYKDRALKHFNSSVKNFDAYLKEQCEFDASSAVGGNAAGDMRFSCRIEIGQFYLQQLQKRADWFQSR